MGDKSPKSTQKMADQKEVKAEEEKREKEAATEASHTSEPFAGAQKPPDQTDEA
ncbi:MAG TPA: hypothetical protein VK610_09750 [Rhodothermales bacterium]|nr:hypothetical protein [Rhodothermales bacterium]